MLAIDSIKSESIARLLLTNLDSRWCMVNDAALPGPAEIQDATKDAQSFVDIPTQRLVLVPEAVAQRQYDAKEPVLATGRARAAHGRKLTERSVEPEERTDPRYERLRGCKEEGPRRGTMMTGEERERERRGKCEAGKGRRGTSRAGERPGWSPGRERTR